MRLSHGLRVLVAPAALAVAACVWLGAWLAVWLPATDRVAALDASTTAVALLGGVCALLAALEPRNRRARRAFLFLGLGAIAWGLGNGIWTYYEVIAGTGTPFPSAADVGFLSALPLLGTGVLLWPRASRSLGRGRLLEAALFASALSLVSLEFLIGPLLEDGVAEFADLLALAYPVCDLALIVIVIGGLLVEGWTDRGRLVLVAAGLLGLVVADFGLAVMGDAYATGVATDVGWVAAFGAIGVSATLRPRWAPRRDLRIPPAAAGLVLAGLLGLAAGYEVYDHWARNGLSGRIQTSALSVLLVLTVARSWHVARTQTREAQEQRVLALASDHGLGGLGDVSTSARLLRRLVGELGLAGAGLYTVDGADIGPKAQVPPVASRAQVDLARRAARAARTVVVSGRDVPEGLASRGVRSILSVPLRADDRSLGALQLLFSGRGASCLRRRAFCEQLADQLARRLDLAHTRAEVERAYAERQESLEASRTGVCLFASGRARFWNSAFVELVGFEPDEEISWSGFLGRLDLAAGLGEEFSFWSDDQRFLRVRFSATGNAELLVSVDDLTDHERERATRDRFVAEVVAAQEREARRVAERLHDDAVQQLTALALRLELEGQRSDNVTLTGFARDASRVTASLRRLLVELHPVVLESQGLAAAVEAAGGTLRESGVEVDVTSVGRRLPTELEQLSYRLVQEALANALAHSGAARVEVSIAESGDVLRCQVRDDGGGFDPERLDTAVAEGRLGLHLVRERVSLARGRFLIESRPGSGTTFSFELPIGRSPRSEHAPLQEAVS